MCVCIYIYIYIHIICTSIAPSAEVSGTWSIGPSGDPPRSAWPIVYSAETCPTETCPT